MCAIASDAGENTCCSGIGISVRCLLLLLGCWLTSQCALRPTPRDLAVYVNRDISGIVELEDTALKRYGAMTGDNYISDQALRASLDTKIIPVYTRFASLAGKIKPQTEPVQKLHALYRQAAALRLQGFRTVLLAIDTQDPDLILQANRMLKEGQHCVTQWRTRLAAMAGRYGLELKPIPD